MIERYTFPEMRALWSDENRFKKWLEVEIAILKAKMELNLIPKEAFQRIKKRASFNLSRIKELEEKFHHDMLAFISNVQESLSADAKYFHFGLTSYDIEDPAKSILLKESGAIIMKDIEKLMQILKEKALKHKNTVMIGRTHGVHAEPITLGFKLAVWYEEMKRNLERVKGARENILYGKISGACGTHSHLPIEVEEIALKNLGLHPAPVSTQILQRDRHSEFVGTLVITTSSIENFATQIRLMQQTERGEVEEPFGTQQRGSSAMPHKRNPVVCERICGLARVIRGYASMALEDITTWDERDISQSSVERIILPDATILTDYILRKFAFIIKNLKVNEKKMLENLKKTNGVVFSQNVKTALISNGMNPDEAYTLVQNCAFRAMKNNLPLKAILLKEKIIRDYLTTDEINSCFDLKKHLKNIDFIFKRVFG